MDTQGSRSERDMSELERVLAPLRPVSGSLSRDRMLYEAGRASIRAEARVRLLMGTSALLLVSLMAQGILLCRERGRRHALEIELAARSREPATPSAVALEPKSVERGEISPSSYLALSSHIGRGGLDESSFEIDGPLPAHTGGDPRPAVPLRVRNARGTIDF